MVDWKKLSDDEKIKHLAHMGAEIVAAKALLSEFESLTDVWIKKIEARRTGPIKKNTK